MSRTLELSRYVVEGDQEQQFLAKRGAMVEAAKENFPGLIDVTPSHETFEEIKPLLSGAYERAVERYRSRMGHRR